jgi:hypothetical protein
VVKDEGDLTTIRCLVGESCPRALMMHPTLLRTPWISRRSPQHNFGSTQLFPVLQSYPHCIRLPFAGGNHSRVLLNLRCECFGHGCRLQVVRTGCYTDAKELDTILSRHLCCQSRTKAEFAQPRGRDRRGRRLLRT